MHCLQFFHSIRYLGTTKNYVPCKWTKRVARAGHVHEVNQPQNAIKQQMCHLRLRNSALKPAGQFEHAGMVLSTLDGML